MEVEPHCHRFGNLDSMKIKSTGVLGVITSGSDAPGMNAALRSVTRTALGSGFHALGFNHIAVKGKSRVDPLHGQMQKYLNL